nr:hypothetical protein [uncultured Desulfobacter sp.]
MAESTVFINFEVVLKEPHPKKIGPKGWTPEQLGSLAGKTYVTTGANTGAGFEATRMFLFKGAKVIMMNRNADKSTAAIAQVAKQEITVDGFESQLVVNHFGHFFLCELLFERVEASGGGEGESWSSVATRIKWG